MDIKPNPLPQQPQVNRPMMNFPNQQAGHPHPAMMGMQMRGGSMINPLTDISEQEEKKREFARSVYVSGFEKTVTSAMVEKHFSKVKPVHGIKLPMSKFNENKGFAFIYFGSEEDATTVKRECDRTAILTEKIRVTKTVVAENLSKMIFKMKCTGKTEEEVKEIAKNYFNDENLEKEVDRIIFSVFGRSVEINKIVVPTSKKGSQPLSYARVFFYISNLKEAVQIARRNSRMDASVEKNEYETVLGHIVELLNND
jgi:RNA recognition motif-containing protein